MVEDIPCKVAGQVPSIERDPLHGFDPQATIPAKERKKMDRFIEFALVAAREALTQAGWSPASAAEQDRTATVIATGIGGFSEIANAVHTRTNAGRVACLRSPSPLFLPTWPPDMCLSPTVSVAPSRAGHRLRGRRAGHWRCCTDDPQRRGGYRPLRRAEAAIHRVSLAGFAAARALSSAANDQPEAASRPFDRDRDGFVMGEGAGLIVIESLEHALARGATPLAELVGYGTSADAYHLTAGPEDGNGARRAMEMAIRQAGVAAE